MQILVLHGPNLNLLGKREPQMYGDVTLDEINCTLKKEAQISGVQVQCMQSNNESEFIDAIQQASNKFAYLIINAAAFTHTSIAIRDALLAVAIPFIEVHLSNIYSREPFRQRSYLSDIASGVICGFGATSYYLALQAVLAQFRENNGHTKN